jgi:hypothetical protein
MEKSLAIDLYCGLGGWAEGFLAEGYRVIGFDIERHDYGTGGYPAELVLQDVTTLHGSQFRDASCIVASPPCQEYSYMAMPWSRAKEKIRKYESGELDVKDLTRLFDACFRIQREASEAGARYIPLVVENVRGAQRWVGQAKWHFGSYYLWGDVPALMPITLKQLKQPGRNFHFPEKTVGHLNQRDGHSHTRHLTNQAEHIKQPGIKWFQDGAATFGSKSDSRKAVSALIAKIPFPLAQHIARCFVQNSVEVSC